MPEIYYRVCIVNAFDQKETVYLGTNWLEAREQWCRVRSCKSWIDWEDKDGNPHPCLELVKEKACESLKS